MVALDATNPSSPGLKLLRSYLNNARMEFLEVKRLYFLYSINTYHTFIQLEEIIYFIDRFSLILANNLGFDKSSFRWEYVISSNFKIIFTIGYYTFFNPFQNISVMHDISMLDTKYASKTVWFCSLSIQTTNAISCK